MIGETEPILIKWKVSPKERKEMNAFDEEPRIERVKRLRKLARATPESRAKSKHDRTVSFRQPLHPCSCLDNDYKTPCNVMLKQLEKFKK